MIANAVNVRRPYTASAINKAGTAFLCESIADVCTPGNPREVTEEIILELYKKAF